MSKFRDTQEQYRHSHGLDCKEVMTRHAFQAEMVTASTLCTQRILNEYIALYAQVAIAGTRNEEDILMEEIEHCMNGMEVKYQRLQ